jgi:peptidoglycan/xylan/chitin deacetylase (PgdA/CDA1 family)
VKESAGCFLFILILVFYSLLLSGGILNTNTTTSSSTDAFAKKIKKTSSSDSANGRGSDTSRDKASGTTTSDSDKQGTEPIVPLPLPVETPANNKFVIINFDDSHESDYTYAKPILDKYRFKATFFEVCNWIEAGYHDEDISTTWQQIAALQQDGMDIQAHTMTHPNLNKLSQADLDYEIGQSKQCLENHGINATIFAYPGGRGADNPEVVNTVAKYYNIARTNDVMPSSNSTSSEGKSALTFLHCDGGGGIDNGNDVQQQQIDCRTSFSDGTLTPSNRYSLNSWAHKHVVRECSPNTGDDLDTCEVIRHEYNNAQMFEKFVTAVNSQYSYNNKDGIVRAIPIIIYHLIVTYPDLSYSNRHVDTTLNLYDAEMKYLYDNGFKVITMSDLGYDENSKSIYIKQ